MLWVVCISESAEEDVSLPQDVTSVEKTIIAMVKVENFFICGASRFEESHRGSSKKEVNRIFREDYTPQTSAGDGQLQVFQEVIRLKNEFLLRLRVSAGITPDFPSCKTY